MGGHVSELPGKRSAKIIIFLALLGASLAVCILLVFAQRRRDASQTTRARRVSTPPSRVTVKPGGNLQAAVNNARYGDTIVLQAGATYNGPLVLPFKEGDPAMDEYITITTSDVSGI